MQVFISFLVCVIFAYGAEVDKGCVDNFLVCSASLHEESQLRKTSVRGFYEIEELPFDEDSDKLFGVPYQEKDVSILKSICAYVKNSGQPVLLDAVHGYAAALCRDPRYVWSFVVNAIMMCDDIVLEKNVLRCGCVTQPKERIEFAMVKFFMEHSRVVVKDVMLSMCRLGYRGYSYEIIEWKEKCLRALDYNTETTEGVVCSNRRSVDKVRFLWRGMKNLDGERLLKCYNGPFVNLRYKPILYQMMYLQNRGLIAELRKHFEPQKNWSASIDQRLEILWDYFQQHPNEYVSLSGLIPGRIASEYLEDILRMVFRDGIYVDFDDNDQTFAYFPERGFPIPSPLQKTEEVFLHYLSMCKSVERAVLCLYHEGHLFFPNWEMGSCKNALDVLDLGAANRVGCRMTGQRLMQWKLIKADPSFVLNTGLALPDGSRFRRRDALVFGFARSMCAKNFKGVNNVRYEPAKEVEDILKQTLSQGPRLPGCLDRCAPLAVYGDVLWERLTNASRGFIRYIDYDSGVLSLLSAPKDIPENPPCLVSRVLELGRQYVDLGVGPLYFFLVQEGYKITFYDATVQACVLRAWDLFPEEDRFTEGEVSSERAKVLLNVAWSKGFFSEKSAQSYVDFDGHFLNKTNIQARELDITVLRHCVAIGRLLVQKGLDQGVPLDWPQTRVPFRMETLLQIASRINPEDLEGVYGVDPGVQSLHIPRECLFYTNVARAVDKGSLDLRKNIQTSKNLCSQKGELLVRVSRDVLKDTNVRRSARLFQKTYKPKRLMSPGRCSAKKSLLVRVPCVLLSKQFQVDASSDDLIEEEDANSFCGVDVSGVEEGLDDDASSFGDSDAFEERLGDDASSFGDSEASGVEEWLDDDASSFGGSEASVSKDEFRDTGESMLMSVSVSELTQESLDPAVYMNFLTQVLDAVEHT